jgi:hypothetical protein
MLRPHHFAALERQMIFWGYILHFFIYLVFSSSTYSDQFMINTKILDVIVRVVIRPAFSSLIKDENKLCVLLRTRLSELRTRWLQRCYPINFVKKNKSTLFCESTVFFLNVCFLLLSCVFFPSFFGTLALG